MSNHLGQKLDGTRNRQKTILDDVIKVAVFLSTLGRRQFAAWPARPTSRERTHRALIMIAPFDREAVLEETIADLEALYEWHAMILSQAKVGVLDWPVNQARVYMSPCLKSILGYREHELPNAFSEWLNHIHSDDRAKISQQITDAVAGGEKSFQAVHRVTRRDGSDAWILFRAKIAKSDHGRPKRLLGAVIDISDIRQMMSEIAAVAASN